MQLSDLRPNPKNPRKITDKKIQALKKSLEEFGDLSGIVFNRRTGMLIGGHQRVKFLTEDFNKGEYRKTHFEMVDDQNGFVCLNGERLLSYREVDWDENKEKAANIAANKGAGDWDWAELSQQLLELDDANYDLSLTMFSESELESALGLKEDKKKDEESKNNGPREAVCPDCGCEFLVGKQ